MSVPRDRAALAVKTGSSAASRNQIAQDYSAAVELFRGMKAAEIASVYARASWIYLQRMFSKFMVSKLSKYSNAYLIPEPDRNPRVSKLTVIIEITCFSC